MPGVDHRGDQRPFRPIYDAAVSKEPLADHRRVLEEMTAWHTAR
ncbi:hypothetical protein I551_4112 [Mycobacterium ulcerans str. Harvey]|uniref:Uncharacterized protein n=1 Tax=Mycobacterium ulcerans str. Harvey TaxID=1299332 RepID=A0ABN0QXP8_MYCUL|nr:hypothetical protein I551_4112 [Mycobacterium ulcerans str. Harvey]